MTLVYRSPGPSNTLSARSSTLRVRLRTVTLGSDFVREIHRHLGRRVDTVVVSTSECRPDLLARYAEEGACPVAADVDVLGSLVPRVLTGPFALTERFIRHDAERVVLAIWPELAETGKRPRGSWAAQGYDGVESERANGSAPAAKS